MSAAQPYTAAAAAAASARATPKKRPRHFWEGPDHANEGDEEKQGAAHVAPVTRLYRHALESVFGFLKLDDLGRVLSVSRSWSAAVRSMASIHAALTDAGPPHLLAASALAHHVRELGFADPVSSCDLFVLSRHLPSLTSLSCTVELAHAPRVYFASTLRSLTLWLEGDESRVPSINDAIVVISRLPNVVDLTLELPGFFPALSFAPLAAAAQLRDLTLRSEDSLVEPPHRQLDQLRTLSHLRKMAVPRLSLACLAYLLRLPHSLHYQELHTVNHIDDAAAAALSTLPSLTTLKSYNNLSVAFLPSLTRLRSFLLCLNGSAHLAADIVAGLSCCSTLTELTVKSEDVTSKHLSQALSQLPLLCKLSLFRCSALESLSFLSACTHLAQSLQSLWIHGCRNAALHSTDLKHVLTLKNLTALKLHQSFVEPLDECTQHLLEPPSVVLPALRSFSYGPN